MEAPTELNSWPEKLEKLQEYVAAKKKSREVHLERDVFTNAPWRVIVSILPDAWTFTLDTSEIVEVRGMVDGGELDVPELFA